MVNKNNCSGQMDRKMSNTKLLVCWIPELETHPWTLHLKTVNSSVTICFDIRAQWTILKLRGIEENLLYAFKFYSLSTVPKIHMYVRTSDKPSCIPCLRAQWTVQKQTRSHDHGVTNMQTFMNLKQISTTELWIRRFQNSVIQVFIIHYITIFVNGSGSDLKHW